MTEQRMNDKPVWVDGDPLMEAIAAAVYEQCGRALEVPLTVDDPRNIAAVAASVARDQRAPAAAEQRLTVDTITSDQLDALYDRIELLTARVEPLPDRELIDKLINGGPGGTVRLVSQGMWQERDRALNAEDAIARARDLHHPVDHRGRTICAECSAYGGSSTDNAPVEHPCPTLEALDEPKEPTPSTFTLLHHACGQLADIPGDVTLHPGRLSWPGHDCPADTPKEPTS